MVAKIKFKINEIYEGQYTEATYGKKLEKIFKKIINLPYLESDNEQRFKYVKNYKQKIFGKTKNFNMLDVGSGLGVFPWRVLNEGWDITALDPDKINIEHIKKNIGIKTIKKDFIKLANHKKYNIITINKVLEHLLNPQEILIKAKNFLKKRGFIYLEVPDVRAKINGKNSEEFFIEHYHVFSEKSLKILTCNSRLVLKKIKRLREPSGKFTIRAILENN
tara:strand:+ start:2694 stop:3353 length:660 start_codon:yes stop_codon:yes gene_type:complete